AAITINSTIRQARSIFSKKLGDAYKDIKLPNLQPFIGVKSLREPTASYKLPPAKLVKLTFDAAVDGLVNDAGEKTAPLSQSDPDAYRAFLLAVGLGLRAKEIRFVR